MFPNFNLSTTPPSSSSGSSSPSSISSTDQNIREDENEDVGDTKSDLHNNHCQHSKEDDNEQQPAIPVQKFDRRLPVTHSYLGNTGQGELPAESLFEEPNAEIKVSVLVMSEVALLPGQTLPLQFYTPTSVQFLNDPARQRTYFALITADDEFEMHEAEDFSRIPCHPVGTLFQIQNALIKGESRITLQVIGRQRCRLVSFLSRHDIHCEDLSVIICENVTVKVLEEKLLPKEIIYVPECSFYRLPKNERFKYLSSLSPHSTFTLSQLSTDGFVHKLVQWLLYWFKRRQIDLIVQQGLTMFSFWVAANIPMSLEKKLELLKEDSTDRRLRIEWRIISMMNSVVCIDCDEQKCHVSDIINLSVEGNSTHFVNPGGFVHDLFTVKRVQNTEIRGEPTAEFSWFPGYKWTIIECSNCRSHLGWRFTSEFLIPHEFFGISRRSFRLACLEEST